jgi:uncharacterized RDD family membrane protein YckC
MTTIHYPRLIKRLRALMIDSVIVPTAVLLCLVIGDLFHVTHTYAKLALFFLPIFLLEPCMVAFTGGTIGHHFQKLRVTRRDGNSRINIFSACLRFLVKILFGWFSLSFLFVTKRHQALHDYLAGSLLVHTQVAGLPEYDILSEHVDDSAEFIYPSKPRRISMILLYCLLGFIATSIAASVLVTADCFLYRACTPVDRLLDSLLSFAWLVFACIAIVKGWRGQLAGCRKTSISKTKTEISEIKEVINAPSDRTY